MKAKGCPIGYCTAAELASCPHTPQPNRDRLPPPTNTRSIRRHVLAVSIVVRYECHGRSVKASAGLEDLMSETPIDPMSPTPADVAVYVSYCPSCGGSHFVELAEYAREQRNATLLEAREKDPQKRA